MAQHHATLTMLIQFVKSYNDFMWLMKSSDMSSDSAGQCMIYKNIEKVTGEVCITRLIKWGKKTQITSFFFYQKKSPEYYKQFIQTKVVLHPIIFNNISIVRSILDAIQ